MEKQYVNRRFPHLLHGGDYNPDQWQDSPEILSEDMRLMKLAHVNEMSVGIFAWAALEPEEGVYDFSFLDRTMDDVYRNGGRVILATPSGARPAWLDRKYPEVLRTREDGLIRSHGGRENHCLTSPVFREKVAKIDRLLAERYRNHPALYAWHLSNEYNGACYCPLCRAAFREWLKRKYGTLEALNKQWWTAFWAHTYTDWEEIDPPSPLGETATHGLTLDWKRFTTDQTTDFMKAEIRAVREFTPDIPVTTNLMGFYKGLDYRVMAKELDFVSNDSYPAWRGDASDIRLAAAKATEHDMIRCLKQKPFLLMESTPSCVNWHAVNKLKRPGQHILASLQTVAHGSDSVQYFQWRKSRGAAEKFHGAVVDHVGHEHTRVFAEVAQLGERLEALDAVAGTGTVSRVAMLYDWDNRWALEDAQGFCRNDKKVLETFQAFYYPLWERGINVDVIGAEDDFARYDLLIAPQRYMVSEALEKKLADYVEKGGTLVGTYMTGMVNKNDLCWLGGFPAGRLKDVFGIWNEEIDTLYPGEANTVAYGGRTVRAVDYCEIIHPQGAEVLATYASDFYAGGAAATVNMYGKGRAYYVAFRDEGDFTDALLASILAERGIASDFDGGLPAGVTAHSRTDGERLYVFLENYNREAVTTATALAWTTAERGEPVTGTITLHPWETLVLTRAIPRGSSARKQADARTVESFG